MNLRSVSLAALLGLVLSLSFQTSTEAAVLDIPPPQLPANDPIDLRGSIEQRIRQVIFELIEVEKTVAKLEATLVAQHAAGASEAELKLIAAMVQRFRNKRDALRALLDYLLSLLDKTDEEILIELIFQDILLSGP